MATQIIEKTENLTTEEIASLVADGDFKALEQAGLSAGFPSEDYTMQVCAGLQAIVDQNAAELAELQRLEDEDAAAAEVAAVLTGQTIEACTVSDT